MSDWSKPDATILQDIRDNLQRLIEEDKLAWEQHVANYANAVMRLTPNKIDKE